MMSIMDAWVLLDADRHLVGVFSSEAAARESAKMLGDFSWGICRTRVADEPSGLEQPREWLDDA